MKNEQTIIGLDLGSRRTKAILLENNRVKEARLFESWSLEKKKISDWVAAQRYDFIGTTGYSRRLAADVFSAKAITEIRAFGLGASFFTPSARTLIDIGGQDAKTIHLGPNGQSLDFEMNDRCAAGTGKFFELAARTLGLTLEEMPLQALQATQAVAISSTCAVFAESEIIGHLAQGLDGPSIAQGIYRSVADRLFAMLQRIGHEEPVILVGGGANPCLANELSRLLHCPVEIPPDGSFFGAVGVALYAGKENDNS